jgi:hypothetical protein
MDLKIISKLPLEERVEYGRKIERLICNELTKQGVSVIEPLIYEDKYLKIDGYICVDEDKIPIQVKYRSNGNDILMEVAYLEDKMGAAKEIEENIELDGRDMVGCAQIYLCLSMDGRTLRMCKVSELKNIAIHMVKKLIECHKKYGKTSYKSKLGEIKFMNDPSNGRRKIILFIHPDKLSSCNIIQFERSLFKQ